MSDENKTTQEEIVESVSEEQAEKEEKEETLEDKIKKIEEERDAYKDKWMRAVAEFENFKKRNNMIRLNSYEEGKAETVLKILPIGDNLDRAIKSIKDEQTLNGLKLMQKSFEEVLSSMQIEEIKAEGEEFNPNFHEAVMQAEGSEEDSGKVQSVLLKGYKCGSKILRYASVVVYR